MSLYVDSVDAVGEKLVELGGTRLEETMTEVVNADGSALKLGFFTDPMGPELNSWKLCQPLGRFSELLAWPSLLDCRCRIFESGIGFRSIAGESPANI